LTNAKNFGYDQTVIEFLNSQNGSTRNVYQSNFRYVIEFTGINGKEILESKKADKEFQWEKRTVELKQWGKKKGLSDSLVKGIVAVLRSFFVYYRTPLVFTRQEKNKVGGRVQRINQDYQLTNEDISKLVLVADLREKYIVLAGKSFGLRASDFIRFTYGSFRSVNLNQEAPIFLGELNTIKEGVPANPFIDTDLQPIIKAILDANPTKPDNEHLLTFNDIELTSTLQNLAKKANIQLGGKHLRFHCFRKYLIDRLSSLMSESKWKQIIGKAISEGAYVSSFELKESYAKVMKMTTISTTNGNGKVTKISQDLTALQSKVSDLEKSNRQANYSISVLMDILKAKKILAQDYEIDEVLHEVEEKAEEDQQRFDDENKN
jgi:integrase